MVPYRNHNGSLVDEKNLVKEAILTFWRNRRLTRDGYPFWVRIHFKTWAIFLSLGLASQDIAFAAVSLTNQPTELTSSAGFTQQAIPPVLLDVLSSIFPDQGARHRQMQAGILRSWWAKKKPVALREIRLALPFLALLALQQGVRWVASFWGMEGAGDILGAGALVGLSSRIFQGIFPDRMAANAVPQLPERASDKEWRRAAELEAEKLERLSGFSSRDSDAYRMVRGILDNLLRAARRDPNEYQLDIVADDSPNAFIMTPTKRVFITRGLLEAMIRHKVASEDMLAFILGHEISHDLLGHYIDHHRYEGEDESDGEKRKKFVIMESAYQFAQHAFSYGVEYRCDEKALGLMDVAGYNPNAALQFHQFLIFLERDAQQRFREEHPDKYRGEEIAEIEWGWKIPSLIESHPPGGRRIKMLDDAVRSRPWRHDAKPMRTFDPAVLKPLTVVSSAEKYRHQLGNAVSARALGKLKNQATNSRQIQELLAVYLPGTLGDFIEHYRSPLGINLVSFWEEQYVRRYKKTPDQATNKLFLRGNHAEAGLKLFTSWDDLSEQGRNFWKGFFERDEYYQKLTKNYQAMAETGIALWRQENPQRQAGLERDIEEWLRFYSFIPTQAGLTRLESILSRLEHIETMEVIFTEPPFHFYSIPGQGRAVHDSRQKHLGAAVPNYGELMNLFMGEALQVLSTKEKLPSSEIHRFVQRIDRFKEEGSPYWNVSAERVMSSYWVGLYEHVMTRAEFNEWAQSLHTQSENVRQRVLALIFDDANRKRFCGDSMEERINTVVAFLPEVSAWRDDFFRQRVLADLFETNNEAFNSAVAAHLHNALWYHTARFKSFEKHLEKENSFVDFIRRTSASGHLFHSSEYARAANRLKASSEEWLQALGILTPLISRIPDGLEYGTSWIDGLSSHAYDAWIREQTSSVALSEKLSAICRFYPLGHGRDALLTKTLQEEGRALPDFLSVRDAYTRKNADEVAQTLRRTHGGQVTEWGRKFKKAYKRRVMNPLGIAETAEREEADPREISAAVNLQEKAKAGALAFGWARRDGYFDGLSFAGQLDRLREIFPESSPERDEAIVTLAEGVDVDQATEETVLGLLVSPIYRIQWGRRIYKHWRERLNGAWAGFRVHLSAIVAAFPDFTLERDEYLTNLINDDASTEREIEEAVGHLTLNRPPSGKSAVIFTEAALELMRDKAEASSPREKAEVILWTLGLRTKPTLVLAVEDVTGKVVSDVTQAVDGATSLEKTLFLRELLEGENGLFSSDDAAAQKFFLDTLFTVLVSQHDVATASTRKLKALFDTVFANSGVRKKSQLVVRLALCKSQGKSLPDTVAEFISAYGLIAVKTAQWIATRTQILPPEYRTAFMRLTNQADPFAKPDVFEVVRQTFDREPEEVFPIIGNRLGAASIKQVHRVQLADGRRGIVKVLRPTVPREVRGQLRTLRAVIDMVEREQALFGVRLPAGMVDEVDRLTNEELDFGLEVRHHNRLKANIEARWQKPNGDGFQIGMPAVMSEYTQGSVITEEEAHGRSLEDLQKERANTIAARRTIIKEIFAEIFDDAYFHADLHPGNILVNLEKSMIHLIDAGVVGTLSVERRKSLFRLLLAIQYKDRVALRRWILSLRREMPEAQRAPLARQDIEALLDDYLNAPLSAVKVGDFLTSLVNRLTDLGITLPDEYFALIKTLSNLDYLLEGITEAEGFVVELMTPRLAKHMLSGGQVMQDAAELDRDWENLPERLDRAPAAAAAEPAKEVGVISEAWKMDHLPKGTRIRWTARYPDQEFRLLATYELKEGVNLMVEPNVGGFKGVAILPKPMAQVEVFVNNAWVTLGSLQTSRGNQAKSESLWRLPGVWKLLGIPTFVWLEELAHLVEAYGWAGAWRELKSGQWRGVLAGSVNIGGARPGRELSARLMGPLVSLFAGWTLLSAGITSPAGGWAVMATLLGAATLARLAADLLLLPVSPQHELRPVLKAFQVIARAA